jgi:multimeric flavodoxin WrbA
MKIIGISGSPRKDGNTDRLVRQILTGASTAGAQTVFHHVADLNIKGCSGCASCRATGVCVTNDAMSPVLAEILDADAVVFGTPVYMGQMTGQMKTFVDRLLPVLKTDYTSRLAKRPAMVWVFTQGNADAAAFRSYMDQTSRFLGFLGFTPKDILCATGTRAKGDIEKQTDLLAQASQLGARLAK